MMRPREIPRRRFRTGLAILAAGVCSAGVLLAQSFEEFNAPRSDSRPFGIAAGPDGAVWFTEASANKIARITTAGAITEFGLPADNGGPVAITTGPDGNLWFVEDRNAVGRITPEGAVAEFPIPGDLSFVYGITAGPDGNMWFTYQSIPKDPNGPVSGWIGRITLDGDMSQFPLPGPDAAPWGIASGPDGNLWFADVTGGAIGRITPEGKMKEIPLPTAGASPYGIAPGRDGNLWFTERLFFDFDFSYGSIGRITPDGVVTEFPIPISGGDPFAAIAAGPDGSLWFTENFVNKIGKITTAGEITEIELATRGTQGNGPVGIAAGPDGNIWFTEQFSGKVARIRLSDSCALSTTRLCLNGLRFAAEAFWARIGAAGGSGHALNFTSDAGYLWFFSPDNPEIVVKVLDGCSANGHYWVFAGGLTDFQVTLRLTDTQTGQVKTYTNPVHTPFRPIQDTRAFACP